MNWLSRVLNRITGWDRPTGTRIVSFGRTDAGVYVNADNALKNATVWACIQYLTRTVAQLPWHVMVKDGKGAAMVASTNPADRVLNTRPCPDMSAFAWRQTMLMHVLLRGNAFAEIERDNRGAVYALWPIHPERVTVLRTDTGALQYEVHGSSGSVILDAADMFHIRGLGDGPVGYGVIDYAAQSIGWAQATEIFGAAFFGQGMNPSGIITTEKGLSIPAQEELRADLKKLYGGPKGQRTAILDAGMKFEKLSQDQDASQFIETRQHQVEEICRWFGCPPHKVMHLLRATFSNIEHQSIEVVVDSITPWAKAFEQEADYKLFGNNRQGLYTKMSLQALMRGDNESRMKFYKGLMELGVPPNRLLELEDMNGIGPDGDVSFVSNNIQPLKRAIEGKGVKTAPAPGDTIEELEPIPSERPVNGIVLNRA